MQTLAMGIKPRWQFKSLCPCHFSTRIPLVRVGFLLHMHKFRAFARVILSYVSLSFPISRSLIAIKIVIELFNTYDAHRYCRILFLRKKQGSGILPEPIIFTHEQITRDNLLIDPASASSMEKRNSRVGAETAYFHVPGRCMRGWMCEGALPWLPASATSAAAWNTALWIEALRAAPDMVSS